MNCVIKVMTSYGALVSYFLNIIICKYSLGDEKLGKKYLCAGESSCPVQLFPIKHNGHIIILCKPCNFIFFVGLEDNVEVSKITFLIIAAVPNIKSNSIK